MVFDLMNTPYADDGEPSIAPGSIPVEGLTSVSPLSNPLCSEMSTPMLAACCLRELNKYHRGEPCTDMFGVELLRRAVIQDDQEAWVQHCLGGVVRDWLRGHPNRAAAYRLASEEYYVAQAFERFWQARNLNQRVQFNQLSVALQYLRASLNGAILDTLRAYAWPREVSLPQPREAEEPEVEDGTDVWHILKTILSNSREQRLAYLLFHCGLKAREIVRNCPQEFSDVREIYRLRCTIMQRVLHNVDALPWQLS